MLPKYNPFELFLMRFLYCLGALAIASKFFHWRLVSTLSLLDSILRRGISLGTCAKAHGLFQTIRLSRNTLYFLHRTSYLVVSFFFEVMILFWFSIFFGTLLGIRAYGLLSRIAHTGNSYRVLATSISVELLLLVGGCYRSSLVLLSDRVSLGRDSNISMLSFVLSFCSTYFSVEGMACTLVLRRLWWGGGGYYLLLSFHWFLVLLVTMDTCV